MEKELKIFIAGAKELKQERNCIKVLANDLSSKYGPRGIHVIAHSYEHFDDNQKSYNDFIEKEADIVIFILKGKIGSKTEEEFLKATDSFRKENRPEVIVFVHEYNHDEITSDIGRIQGLIAGRLGDKYHIDYSSLDDLRSKSRDRIERFVDQHESIASSHPKSLLNQTKDKVESSKIISWGRKQKRWIFGILAGLVLMLGIGLLYLYQQNKKPFVIFAGGGSVVNFIKDITNDSIDIRKSPDYIYLNLGSGTAWSLLAEEANRYINKEGGENEIISICLSADKIDSTFFNEKTEDLFEKAQIVGYYLGEDPLVVYISNKLADTDSLLKRSDISPQRLVQLIQDVSTDAQNRRLFTTSQTSGTLRLYQNCISKVDTLIQLEKMYTQEKAHLFYQDTQSSKIGKYDFFAILGSKHYRANNLTKDSYRELYVKDDDGYVTKPMYVYFVAKMNGNIEYLTIEDPVIDFLKRINAPENMGKDKWEEVINGRLKAIAKKNQVLYLNDCEN